ncbi:MAG: acyltransferase family protein, partial [Sphingobacterium sp.]
GALIGLLAFVFDPFSNLITSFNFTEVFLMLLSACFLIPYPAVPQRYFNLFHLNPPTWSLFWEYIANIVYAVWLVRVSKNTLWIILIIAAGLLYMESYQSGYLAVGFGGDNFWAGGIRLSFSFTAGILLYRSNGLIRQNISFWLLSLGLSLIFFIPYSEIFSPIIDPLIVIFYFPLLISLAAGKINFGETTKKLGKWLGDISYPLYVIHYPFIWIFMSYVEKESPDRGNMAILVSIGMVCLLFLAHVILRWVDEPIRYYLTERSKRINISRDVKAGDKL